MAGMDHGEGRVVEWDGAFGAELAQWDFDPGASVAEVPQAVELKVQQLAESHPGAAQDGEAVAGEGSARAATAAMRSRSASGGRARGRGRSSRGMSLAKTSWRGGRSAHPHTARSSKNERMSTTVRFDTDAATGLSRASQPRQGRRWFHTRKPSMWARSSCSRRRRRVARMFAEAEIVELTLLVGVTLLLNRYATSLGLPVDPSTIERLAREGFQRS